VRRFFSDSSDTPVRAGDFGFGNRHRIYILADGRSEGHPWSNIGEQLHAIDLRVPTRYVRVTDDDVHIRQELVAEIAHEFAERVQDTSELPRHIRVAATRLLNTSAPAYYANHLFPGDARDPRLIAIFTAVIEKLYPESLDQVEELKRVAHLAIFSVLLLE
jgi:hypothetical protein